MKKLRVLVLGGRGFVGREVVKQLTESGWATPVVASRSAKADTRGESIAVDTRDQAALTSALKNVDAVVNCVAGEGAAISDGAAKLVSAAKAAGMPRIVHMSTMSVYGKAEGRVDESHPLRDDLGWYGHAKIQAEKHMMDYVAQGGEVVVLRPGCVIGPGSHLWCDRIASLLKAGRLGELGAGGDGPANLVDVRDVAQAAVKAVQFALPTQKLTIFNLASSDSPRWNEYFARFALVLGATPLRTISARRMKLDAFCIGIPIKMLEKILQRLGVRSCNLPESIPPSLLSLWGQQITLDSGNAEQVLGVEWTPFLHSLKRNIGLN